MHATPESATATTLPVDLAMDVFKLGFANAQGRIIKRERLRRNPFARRLDNDTRLRIDLMSESAGESWVSPISHLFGEIDLPAFDGHYVHRGMQLTRPHTLCG